MIGGGLSQMPGLFPALHQRLANFHSYPGLPEHQLASFAVPPGLGNRAGALWALIIAEGASAAAAVGAATQPTRAPLG